LNGNVAVGLAGAVVWPRPIVPLEGVLGLPDDHDKGQEVVCATFTFESIGVRKI